LVAQKFATEHHELILEPDVVASLEKLTSSMEEPFSDPSILPTYFVSCLARQHVTVALSGDGGDELFAGYTRYGIQQRRQAAALIPKGAWRFYRERLFPLLPKGMRGRQLSYNLSLPWQERYADEVCLIPAFERDMPLLSPEFRATIAESGDPQEILLQLFAKAPASDPISKMLYVDTKTYLVEDILTKVDRMSMLTSLEVRVPILDHMFVEWVTSLGPEWKMRDGKQKYIFRKLAERVGVPREVLYRPKRGFALPLVHWTRNEMKDLILGVLLDPCTLQRGYLDPKGVRHLLDEHMSGKRNHSGRVWRLLLFELWHRNFLGKFAGTASSQPLEVTTSGVAE